MNITICQIRGNSGIDVWAQNLCSGIRKSGYQCNVELKSAIFEVFPHVLSISQREEQVNLIQGNSWNAFAFQKKNIPLVVTEHLVVHDHEFDRYKTPAQKMYHRWIYHCEQRSFAAAGAVVCVSNDTRNKLEQAFGFMDARVIPNGVDTKLFNKNEVSRKSWNLPANKTLLLFSGNLSRRKGADLLPSIMNRLGDDYLLLTTAGKRDRSHNEIPYSRDVGHLNLQQLIEIYNLCDIFILPSRLEGLSLSTLEAMACAKPVIAFNCSSFPELINDEKGGFLPEKDNVKQFVERIQYLAQDQCLREKMGQFNRKKIQEQFTLDRMTDCYLKLYHTLLL